MATKHRHLAAGALVFAVLISAPACATGGYYTNPRPTVDYREMDRWAYDNGFREGRQQGERDARARLTYRVDRDREYRAADNGFYRRGGYPLYQYQAMFRQGYETGYNEGYVRWARSVGRGGRVTPGIVVPPPYGGSPGGYYGSSASNSGYRDGLEAGRDDARAGRSFDPRRPKRYREGDHDYTSRDGSREDYKRDYRAAFQQGYEQGYRDYRR